MGYKNSKAALSDTIKIWKAISLFTDEVFDKLKSKCNFDHMLIEIVKREAIKGLHLDEGIINYCPLCDYYECSQQCFLSEPSPSESCNFGCIKRWSCMDFYENILESHWDKARENAMKFANELKKIL
jgi:hypothetical protein